MRKFYLERVGEIVQTELQQAREGYLFELESEFKHLNRELQDNKQTIDDINLEN